MLDEALTQRLDIFATTDGIDPAVIPFVRGVLETLDVPDEQRTDAALGMLTSHLVGVLHRSFAGEALTSFGAEEVIDAAIAEHPHSLVRATELAGRVHDELGLDLPETETRILALHFATL